MTALPSPRKNRVLYIYNYAQPHGGLKFGERNCRVALLRGSSANPSAIVPARCGRCGWFLACRLCVSSGRCGWCGRVAGVVVGVWSVWPSGRCVSRVACASRVAGVVVWPTWSWASGRCVRLVGVSLVSPVSLVWPAWSCGRGGATTTQKNARKRNHVSNVSNGI